MTFWLPGMPGLCDGHPHWSSSIYQGARCNVFWTTGILIYYCGVDMVSLTYIYICIIIYIIYNDIYITIIVIIIVVIIIVVVIIFVVIVIIHYLLLFITVYYYVLLLLLLLQYIYIHGYIISSIY